MADVRITCIDKPNVNSSYEHITHLGNPAAGWKWTREQVIASLETKQNTFFVLDAQNGKRSNVGVVRPEGKAPYVRTYADGNWNNNLLSLVHCSI